MKILLVDSHPIVRAGCAALLSTFVSDLELFEASSGEEAIALAAITIPSLVIIEVDLPGISGIETCRRLLQRFPQLPILFFSQHAELSIVRQTLDSGASGYLTKQCALELFQEAVKKLCYGFQYIEPELATKLAYNRQQNGKLDPRLFSMTPREMEVFIMLAKGIDAHQIAQNLCISHKTVSNYMTLLKHKLQIKSHVELVHLAIDMGLVRVRAMDY